MITNATGLQVTDVNQWFPSSTYGKTNNSTLIESRNFYSNGDDNLKHVAIVCFATNFVYLLQTFSYWLTSIANPHAHYYTRLMIIIMIVSTFITAHINSFAAIKSREIS